MLPCISKLENDKKKQKLKCLFVIIVYTYICIAYNTYEIRRRNQTIQIFE